VADLYIDSQALADFAGRLRNLASDFSSPLVGAYMVVCDGSLQDDLRDLSTDDTACGASLNNYLTSLASYVEQAIEGAAKIDAELARSVAHQGPPLTAAQ
jgi:hypothetical protein